MEVSLLGSSMLHIHILAVSLPLSQDLCATLLPLLSPSILRGLQDVDDDVRAVAASSLLPVADQLMTIMPGQVESHSLAYPLITFTFNMYIESSWPAHSLSSPELTHFLLFPSLHRSHSFWAFCGRLWLTLMTFQPPPAAFWAFCAHCSPRIHNSTLVGHTHCIHTCTYVPVVASMNQSPSIVHYSNLYT